MSTHVQMRADADESAKLAADRLGLRISELVDAPSHHVAAALLQGVWRADSPDSVVNAALMTALAHAGNYVVGAYQGERMVAAVVGFLGVGHLHSHVAGVDRTIRTGGIGFALKQHQRAWALARSITEVCWTFDPLVSRNAYFNLHKLGASATEYLPDFYGELADGINLGDPTDRLYVRWRLESPAAVAAANGHPADVDAVAMRAEGAAVLVDRGGPLGQFEAPCAEGWALGYEWPIVTGQSLPELRADGRPLLVAVPEDIETLRGHDPGAATQWRYAVRGALAEALDAGYRVDGFSRDGFYALAPGERV